MKSMIWQCFYDWFSSCESVAKPVVEDYPVVNSGRMFSCIAELRTKTPKLKLVKRMYNQVQEVVWTEVVRWD